MVIKCALITDIHYGPDRGTKKGSAALELLNGFEDFIADYNPDFIIDMGDRISDVDRETDIRNLGIISKYFQSLPFKTHHLFGNHDVAAMSIKENEDVMGLSFGSYSFQKNGISFIVWNANTAGYNENGFSIFEEQIKWLEAELDKVSYPAVIFTHAPLDSGSMAGNFYFENSPSQFSGYPTQETVKIRHIIEQSENVVMCINGHTHWNKYHVIDGIHYITIPSLTETFITYPKPHSTWATLEISDLIKIQIYGETPMKYEFPTREKQHHWVHLNKKYSPIKEIPQ